MFYCEECRAEKNWPKSLARSFGRCELCHKEAECYHTPSRDLPPIILSEEKMPNNYTSRLATKVRIYEQALKTIIEESSYCRDGATGGPHEEALRRVYKAGIEAVMQFNPQVVEGSTYLVKRYEGAEPELIIAKPSIDRAGRLEGWLGNDRLAWPSFPDDEIYLLDLEQLPRIARYQDAEQ